MLQLFAHDALDVEHALEVDAVDLDFVQPLEVLLICLHRHHAFQGIQTICR